MPFPVNVLPRRVMEPSVLTTSWPMAMHRSASGVEVQTVPVVVSELGIDDGTSYGQRTAVGGLEFDTVTGITSEGQVVASRW